jgi:hypothetical protein
MLVTLGRSDAILAAHLIEMILYPRPSLPHTARAELLEDAEDLLEFIKIQLNSIAEEEAQEETP